MDAIDRDIVRLLRANGRINQERVASVVGLSRPAVHERVKRLEECGVIRGYEALVDWDAIGLPVAAFVWLRTAGEARCRDVGSALMRLSGETAMVQECHTVTGEWCLLLKVRAASTLGPAGPPGHRPRRARDRGDVDHGGALDGGRARQRAARAAARTP